MTIAVLGTTGAGKTHFLATTLGMAKNDQALAPFGVSSFKATIATDSKFHQDYWIPVFEDRNALPATPPNVRVLEERIATPLSFITEVAGEPLRLLFHDLPGEAILDRTKRNTHLPFLRRADAVIFLIDPLGFGSVRKRLPEAIWRGTAATGRMHTQAHLISAMAEELGATRASEIPVAVAITKSDLIFDAFGEIDPILHEDETQSDRAAQIRSISAVVDQKVLPLLESPELRSVLEAFDHRTMHLIASIGSNPENNGDGTHSWGADFDPKRGIDPLLSVLHRLSL